MPDLVGSYHDFFSVLSADTPERLDAAYRLRYQVYCIEQQFEDRRRCPDERETDDDDDRSVHTLLLHRRSGVAAGTARVILPSPGAARPLPIERLLRPPELAMFQRLPLHRIAEVSRFAVSKEFRRRQAELRYVDAGFPDPPLHPDAVERRLMPHITLGLIRGILGICLEHRVTLLAAVMEPALVRILSRLGLDFELVGPLVQYHGLRQPCIASIAELIRRERDRSSLLWRYIEADVSAVATVPAVAASQAERNDASPSALSLVGGAP
jgi:N-acyl amino acid synthase of PEP-CTERM/exosortase system